MNRILKRNHFLWIKEFPKKSWFNKHQRGRCAEKDKVQYGKHDMSTNRCWDCGRGILETDTNLSFIPNLQIMWFFVSFHEHRTATVCVDGSKMTATVYAVMPFVLVLVAALSCFLVCTHLAASLQSACAELKILAERLTAKVHLEPDVSELKIRMGRLERLMARHQEINYTCNIMSFNFKRHNDTYEFLQRHNYVLQNCITFLCHKF